MTLTIGDRTKDGLIEITDTNWAGYSLMRVTVRELIGSKCWDKFPLRRMRALASRAYPAPFTVRTARVVNRFASGGSDHVTFLLSGLTDAERASHDEN